MSTRTKKATKTRKKERGKHTTGLLGWKRIMCMLLRNFILKLRRFLSLSYIPTLNILCCTSPIIKLKEYKRTEGPISRIKAEHAFCFSKLHNSEL